MNWIWKTFIFIFIAVFLGFGLYKLYIQNRELKSQVDDLSIELNSIQNENKELEYQINFFKNPENLLKELKSQFNYREQGEEMIIVIPKTSSSSEE